ncbi:MAG: hypothetical protein ABI306_05460 [Caulobacteraceae bacterium]
MPYVTLNQALQAFAARTGGVTAEPYTALVDVINNDPTLQSELNTDFSMGYLRGIVPMAPNGTGAQFNPTNLTIGLPIFQGSLEYLNSGDIAFTLGHEQDHSVNAGNIASETMSFDNGVQALIQQGGQDFTSLIQADQQAHAGDEAMAQIAGWNSYYGYEMTVNPGILGPGLASGTKYSSYFVDQFGNQLTNGPTFDSGSYALSVNPGNVNAETRLYYYQANQMLGAFHNDNYANYYGAAELGQIISSDGTTASIDFSKTRLDPTLIAEGLSQYAGDGKSLTLTDPVTQLVYSFTTGTTGVVTSVTSSLTPNLTTVLVGGQGADPGGSVVSQSGASVDIASGYSATITGSLDGVNLFSNATATNAADQTNTFTCSPFVGRGATSTATLTGAATATCTAQGSAALLTVNGADITGLIAPNSTVDVVQSGDTLTAGNATSVTVNPNQEATPSVATTRKRFRRHMEPYKPVRSTRIPEWALGRSRRRARTLATLGLAAPESSATPIQSQARAV